MSTNDLTGNCEPLDPLLSNKILEKMFPGSQTFNEPSPAEGTFTANQYPRVKLEYPHGIHEGPSVRDLPANWKRVNPTDLHNTLSIEELQVLVEAYEKNEYNDAS